MTNVKDEGEMLTPECRIMDNARTNQKTAAELMEMFNAKYKGIPEHEWPVSVANVHQHLINAIKLNKGDWKLLRKPSTYIQELYMEVLGYEW